MTSNAKLTRTISQRVVKKARQDAATLYLDFVDGSTMQIKLAGPTSSVMVRNKDSVIEYAD
jgi:hypothetical protein